MKGRVNMQDVKEGGTYEAIPKGTYSFRVEVQKDGKTKNDDPMISIKLVCLTEPHIGKNVFDNIIISDNPSSPGYKILGRTKHFLHCIGEPYDGASVEYDSDNWNDATVIATVDHEKPNEYHSYVKPIISGYILDERKETAEKSAVPDVPEIDLGSEDTPF